MKNIYEHELGRILLLKFYMLAFGHFISWSLLKCLIGVSQSSYLHALKGIIGPHFTKVDALCSAFSGLCVFYMNGTSNLKFHNRTNFPIYLFKI